MTLMQFYHLQARKLGYINLHDMRDRLRGETYSYAKKQFKKLWKEEHGPKCCPEAVTSPSIN